LLFQASFESGHLSTPLIKEGLKNYILVVFQYAKAKARFFLGLQNQALTRMVLAGHPWPARIL